MRRALIFLAPVLALALTGCPKKYEGGECETNEHCAEQPGYGPICVQGRCQECGADTDCKAGFMCRGNKCVPRPECERDADCAGGKICQAGSCVEAPKPKAECEADADCGAGKACRDGKCVSAIPAGCPSDGNYPPVYFDFDRSLIRTGDAQTLDKNAECIRQLKPARLVIEGNCDERGTREYNMHLGQRRAEAAKKYLVNLGISASEIRTVSYGKERPVCTEHNEECWWRNRRADVRAE